jgi:hypothetical protein
MDSQNITGLGGHKNKNNAVVMKDRRWSGEKRQ